MKLGRKCQIFVLDFCPKYEFVFVFKERMQISLLSLGLRFDSQKNNIVE